MIDDLYNLIGKNMKRIRKELIGLSQEKLAEEINMSRTFLSHIEGPNINVGVSLDTLFLIAKKYNFDIRLFFDGYENIIDINKK